jgi:hypothetical protein
MFPTKHTSEVCRSAIAVIGGVVVIATIVVGSAFSSSQAGNLVAANEGQVGGVPSLLQIPVNFSLADLFQRCETMLLKEIDESGAYIDAGKDSIGTLGIKYKVWRDPLKLSMDRNKLNLDAHVYYWIEAAQIIHKPKPLKGDVVQKLGSCGEGEPPRQAEIGLTTEIALGSDWNLVPKTTVRQVTLLDRCTMTFLNLDQTNKIKKRLSEKLLQAAAVIDKRIGRLNLRSRVEAAWNQLQKPIVVDPAGKYLSITPIDISVSPLNGRGDTVQATVTVKAFITFVWESPPQQEPAQTKPLPSLKQFAQAGNGTHIVLNAVFPFDVASEQLSKMLIGHKYSFSGNNVEVTAASIHRSAGGVEIVLNVSGFLKGIVYLRGKPVFDQTTNMISLENLDFAVDSTDSVTKSFAAAVAGSPGFRARLASQARWSLGKQIDEGKAQLSRTLNRTEGDIKMTGVISGFSVRGIEATPAGTKLPGFPYGGLDKDSFVVELTIDVTVQIESEKHEGVPGAA